MNPTELCVDKIIYNVCRKTCSDHHPNGRICKYGAYNCDKRKLCMFVHFNNVCPKGKNCDLLKDAKSILLMYNMNNIEDINIFINSNYFRIYTYYCVIWNIKNTLIHIICHNHMSCETKGCSKYVCPQSGFRYCLYHYKKDLWEKLNFEINKKPIY